jgi:hypothetical protein
MAFAQSPVTVNITNAPGYAVPSDFAGLSFEIGTQRAGRGGVAGYIFSPTNAPVITLFQNIGLRNLRIGGGTVDGTNAVLLSNSQIDNLFGFAQSVGGLEIIYTLQLENGNPSTNASTAQYIWQRYQANLACFAIGNEPDWHSYSYPPYGAGSDPLITGFASYLSDWGNFAAAVTNVAPAAAFSGPDTGNDVDSGAPDDASGHWANNGTEWTVDFAADEPPAKNVTLITQHFYEADGTTQTNAPAFIDAMLSPGWDLITNQTLYNVMAAPVLARGLPYRFTEANEEVGGLAGASATMASALWTLNFMHWWAAHNCAGVNFHNKPWLLTDTIFYDAAGNYEVYPKAYAIKAFTLGGQGNELLPGVVNTNALNLAAYAVADATNVYVTIINKEHNAGARDAGVTIHLNGFQVPGSASVMYLTAPGGNIAASNGITLGGAVITNNAPWSGQWTALNPVANNQCTLTVPASSAAVVRIAQITGPPVISSWSPVFVTNPVTLYAGASPNFSVAALGGGPIGYQWKRGGVSIFGATNSAFRPGSVGSPGSVNYSCFVTNPAGSASVFWSFTVAPPPFAAYPQAVLALQPEDYWPLHEGPDNGAGNQGVICVDEAGANDGVYSNVVLDGSGYSPATDPAGTAVVFGSVASSDSMASQINGVDVSAPNGTNAEFSVAAWVKGVGQQTANTGIVSKGYFNFEEFTLDTGASNRAYRFEVRTAAGTACNANSTLVANDGLWHHLAGVCDELNGLVLLYIDGQVAASTNIAPGSGLEASDATVPMYIGARPSNNTSGGNNQFFGSISDVALFPYALGAAQVQTLYQAAPAPLLAVTKQTINFTGTLVSATNVAGPYSPVPGAAWPSYIPTNNGLPQFFKARNP